jgi:S1/P1 Nuclease
MIPGHVDGGFHAVGQANELRRPPFVMSAKAYDVYPSHSGKKILEKTGRRQEPGSTVKLAIPVDRLFWTWHRWHPYQTAMTKTRPVPFLALFAFSALAVPASAWNIPGHMLSAAIAYQVLPKESPQTIAKVTAALEKHSWYANQWQARLQDVPVTDHGLVLFMQAARWADDIRMRDKQHHRGPWHYINWPFKPEGQPASVQTKDPEPVNILIALAENEGMVRNSSSDAERRALALAWLFHLVGDIHQPLHTAQLFATDYPQGDRGRQRNLCSDDASRATNGPTQILGRGDYVQLEPYPSPKRGHGAQKPARVSAEPAYRTCEHWL